MTNSSAAPGKRPRFATIAWLVLVLLAAFPIAASILDLVADARTGIPADHEGSFPAIAGIPW